MKNRFFLAISIMVALSLTTIVSAQDFGPNTPGLNFGVVNGTITLPSNGQLTCSQLRFGLHRFVPAGDSFGVQSLGPVTPTPSGPGVCSYSMLAPATNWIVSLGHASPFQFTLSYQVTPGQYVTIEKGQTATRDINITAVNPYEPPR